MTKIKSYYYQFDLVANEEYEKVFIYSKIYHDGILRTSEIVSYLLNTYNNITNETCKDVGEIAIKDLTIELKNKKFKILEARISMECMALELEEI